MLTSPKISARYVMGWWPSKLIVILNIIISLGYSLIDLVIAGQILSAVSVHGSLSVVVGQLVQLFPEDPSNYMKALLLPRSSPGASPHSASVYFTFTKGERRGNKFTQRSLLIA